jgi:hypothetical protein
MGSKDKFFSVTSADKGTDDVGIAQSSGTVSAVSDAKTISGIWAGKTAITVDSVAALVKGMPIHLLLLDSWLNGNHHIKDIVVATKQVILEIAYQAPTDVTGTWDLAGGSGAWDAMMPIGGDLTAANVAMTFWDPNREGGNELTQNFLSGKIYMFPGVIKTILITTAGNVRLFRAATRRPWGKDAQT